MTVLDENPTQPEAAEPPAPATQKPNRRRGWFAAFWRWHFYASVLVIPALFILAVTGLTYMYRAQIDPIFQPGVIVVDVPDGGTRAPLGAQETAVQDAFPAGEIVSIRDGSDGTATVFGVVIDDELRNVYLDPYRLQVTGNLTESDLASDWAVRIHGELLAGTFGDAILELAACWAIVMAITGYYLFFAGYKGRLRMLATRARGAITRQLHSWVGVFVGLGILFLVASGLPWTALWGANVQSLAGGNGLSLWGEDPGAVSTIGDRMDEVTATSARPGWAISQGHMPESAIGADGILTLDAAFAIAADAGVPGPYFVAYPDGEEGVFSVIGDQWHDQSNPAFTDVSRELTAHIDQYSGEVVATYGYENYSAVAQAVSQGIAIHEGRRFGPLSAVMTTLFCLGVIALCVTAPIMWWRRRNGRDGLAAPRGRMPVFQSWTITIVLAALCLFLPLFGISVVVILLLDWLVIRRIPALSRIFGAS